MGDMRNAERMLWQSHLKALVRDLRSMSHALDRIYKLDCDIEKEMDKRMKIFRRKCDAWRSYAPIR